MRGFCLFGSIYPYVHRDAWETLTMAVIVNTDKRSGVRLDCRHLSPIEYCSNCSCLPAVGQLVRQSVSQLESCIHLTLGRWKTFVSTRRDSLNGDLDTRRLGKLIEVRLRFYFVWYTCVPIFLACIGGSLFFSMWGPCKSYNVWQMVMPDNTTLFRGQFKAIWS